jgi:hypothetical protein
MTLASACRLYTIRPGNPRLVLKHIVSQTSTNLSYYDLAPILAGTNENIIFNFSSDPVIRHEGEIRHCNWTYIIRPLLTSFIFLVAGLTSVISKEGHWLRIYRAMH